MTTADVLSGNVLARAADMAPCSVHCIVTSPPYWGLRAYDGEQAQDWPAGEFSPMPGAAPVRVEAERCGLGNERTPDAYVFHLLLVFRAMRRVLRDDGTCWVNLGDSYAGNDLVGIPWRVAFALQADGWLLRSDVVWSKANCLPESVSGHRWERCRVKVGSNRMADARLVGVVPNNTTPPTNRQQGAPPATEWRPCPGCAKCSPRCAAGAGRRGRGKWTGRRACRGIVSARAAATIHRGA